MELSGQLHTVKMKAIKENRTLGVYFDKNSDRYFILSDFGPDGDWEGPTHVGGNDTTDRIIDLHDYGSGIRFVDVPPAGTVVKFEGRGFCDSAKIEITNHAGDPVYQLITTLSGSILLERR